MRFPAIEAVTLGRRVAQLEIGWAEEPVVPDDHRSYIEVHRGQPVPVAGGECGFPWSTSKRGRTHGSDPTTAVGCFIDQGARSTWQLSRLQPTENGGGAVSKAKRPMLLA